MSIEIQRVAKRFGSFVALDNVSLSIPAGQLVALLGPSGSGKTTLLRIIAGLDVPDSGSLTISGADSVTATPRDRKVGFVFQHYALFRHMTVAENIAFGLTVRPRAERPSPAIIKERVDHLLHMVQLEWCAGRYPHQLSGGQRQRIALARALAVQPQILLLDEPFGALDARVRAELRRWLRRLHHEMGVTTVFVTHDQEEAMEVADRVVVINHGNIEQSGTPEEVYNAPCSPFVFDFIGQSVSFPAIIRDGIARFGSMSIAVPGAVSDQEEQAIAYARPHDLILAPTALPDGGIEAVVERIHAIGALARIDLKIPGRATVFEAQLSAEQLPPLALTIGQTVHVSPKRVKVFRSPAPVPK
jgi:sulfate transport system ATP-binding protein